MNFTLSLMLGAFLLAIWSDTRFEGSRPASIGRSILHVAVSCVLLQLAAFGAGLLNPENGGVVPAKAAQFLHGPYRIGNLKVDVAAYMTSKTPIGTYRAPGRFEANVCKFLYQGFERHPVLQSHAGQRADPVHQPANGRALLRHGDE